MGPALLTALSPGLVRWMLILSVTKLPLARGFTEETRATEQREPCHDFTRELPGCHAGDNGKLVASRPTSQHDDEMRSTDLIHNSNQDEAGWMMAGPLHWLPPYPLSSVAFKLIPGQSVERPGRVHQLNRAKALQRFMTLRRNYRNEATHRLSLPVGAWIRCSLLYRPLTSAGRTSRVQLAVGCALLESGESCSLFEAGQGWAGLSKK
ncbi:unnamed protein product [Clonostachys byssicola]|uniref:Secreted protein n=1 Tax=Clonostachys byssicola TaxID=160290 RepID=A0A9N9Y844_9HYPO|nr:unnamed protein product [Clonostachys byssicola]